MAHWILQNNNSAGFYRADMNKLVMALEGIACPT